MREFNPFAAIEIDSDAFDAPEVTRVQKKERQKTDTPPTIFDVEDHFKQTNRDYLIENVSKLNNPRVEQALMRDITQAEDARQRMYLRELLLTAVKNGYPLQEKEKKEVTDLIHGRIRNLHWEYMRKVEAGDEVEHEENLLNNWRRIAWLLSAKNEVMDDEELLFVEQAIIEMQMNVATHPQSRRPKKILEILKEIREAMYFKAFNRTLES